MNTQNEITEFYEVEKTYWGFKAQYGIFDEKGEAYVTKSISNIELRRYLVDLGEFADNDPRMINFIDDNYYTLVQEYILNEGGKELAA